MASIESKHPEIEEEYCKYAAIEYKINLILKELNITSDPDNSIDTDIGIIDILYNKLSKLHKHIKDEKAPKIPIFTFASMRNRKKLILSDSDSDSDEDSDKFALNLLNRIRDHDANEHDIHDADHDDYDDKFSHHDFDNLGHDDIMRRLSLNYDTETNDQIGQNERKVNYFNKHKDCDVDEDAENFM
jgi:hypothetical protein